jgi:hypothetical protein
VSFRAQSCGLTIDVDAASGSWRRLAENAFGGPTAVTGAPDLVVSVQATRARFNLPSLTPLTRGAAGDGSRVVLTDACGSGLDLLVQPRSGVLSVTARPRPGTSHRALRLAAPARTELLWRAALLQYPALWWRGVLGGVPLHVSAARLGDCGVVLAGPGGVGKSTLLGGLAREDGTPVSDNLCVYEGDRLHGLPEPRRVEASMAPRHGRPMPHGRTMPHGRVEQAWAGREPWIRPSLVLVLRRGLGERATVQPVPPAVAARALVAGTYAAGELRRYWAFAATLALGTGLGPAHPAIEQEAQRLAQGARCVEVVLPARPGTSLVEVVDLAEKAWAAHPATLHAATNHAAAATTRDTGVGTGVGR